MYISFNDNGVTLLNASFKSSSISTPTILEGLLLLLEAVLVFVFVSVFVSAFSPSIVVVAFEFVSEFVSVSEFVDDDDDDDDDDNDDWDGNKIFLVAICCSSWPRNTRIVPPRMLFPVGRGWWADGARLQVFVIHCAVNSGGDARDGYMIRS